MKKIALILAFLVVGMVMSGCGSKPQLIKLKDGQTILTADEVEYNDETGFYDYENKDGTTSRINKDDVQSIEDIGN